MNSIDFKKDLQYKAKIEPEIVQVPKMQFVMIDGKGAPDPISGSDKDVSEFQAAMAVVYGIVYSVKFWDKKHQVPAGYAKFTMPPLEALWWMADGSEFDTAKPNEWRWTAMHRLPEFVDKKFFDEIVNELVDKKKSKDFKKARLETWSEGNAVQILHIGPYDQEGPNILKMHYFATENGYKLKGKHHELYFGDPRRTKPERLKTILRHPVEKVL